jgi:hypothetical protein
MSPWHGLKTAIILRSFIKTAPARSRSEGNCLPDSRGIDHDARKWVCPSGCKASRECDIFLAAGCEQLNERKKGKKPANSDFLEFIEHFDQVAPSKRMVDQDYRFWDLEAY